MSPITVLVADDDPTIRSALAALIASEPDLELAGSVSDAEEAIELARAAQPTVAVLDVKMPAGGGAHAARGILRCSQETKIVAHSAYGDRSTVLDMLRAGATSYLLKGASAGEVISTLIRAAVGEGVLSPEITGSVVDELATHMRRRDRAHEDRRQLYERIRRTIDEERFIEVFQPIVDLATARAVGVEALSRFPDEPHQGPDRWFADAARVGLGPELELITARSAIARLDDLRPPGFISVNLSPETLPHCRPEVYDAVAGRLLFEITEHAAIDDYDALGVDLKRMRAGGIRLAVDDAGAGYSSLRHTLQLAPDFIKLDISLTKGIDQDRTRRALAVGLIGFAHELNADIIAEGIETRAELDALRALGVRFGQGYYFARPGDLPLATEAFPAG